MPLGSDTQQTHSARNGSEAMRRGTFGGRAQASKPFRMRYFLKGFDVGISIFLPCISPATVLTCPLLLPQCFHGRGTNANSLPEEAAAC